MMKIQARSLYRHAVKINANMRTVYDGHEKQLGKGKPFRNGHPMCAVRLLSNAVGEGPTRFYADIAVKLGLKSEDIQALEDGFEKWRRIPVKNRYYKVGENLRKMIFGA
jgi:hypothetical protein